MGGKRLEYGAWSPKFNHFERDGKHYARGRYRHDSGEVKAYERSGKTPTEAARNLRKLFRDWSADEDAVVTSTAKLTDMIQRHFEWIEGEIAEDRASPGTIRVYRSIYAKHLERRIRQWRLKDVTTQRLDRLFGDLRTSEGAAIAKTSRSIISAALKIAHRYGAMPIDPMASVRPTPKPKRRDPQTLTAEESIRLVRALREDADAQKQTARRIQLQDLADLALWMLTTSDRIGNALAASWPRIELDTGRARLGPIIVRVPGGGLVEREEDVSTKTRGRAVILPEVTVTMLRRRHLAAEPFTRWVFPHTGRGRKVGDTRPLGPRDPSNTHRALMEALERVGFGHVTSHVFRKTVSTGLRDSGVSTTLIADYLGHATERETEQTYIGDGASHPAIRQALNARWSGLASVSDLDARRDREA